MTTRDWHADALDTVLRVAAAGQDFSANDVWATGLQRPSNGRLLSRAFLAAEKTGDIVRTPRKVRSIGGHQQPITVWRAA